MVIFENVDINIEKAILKNINIHKAILTNIDVDIDIDRMSLRNIDIDIGIDKGIIEISIKYWCKISAKSDNFCPLPVGCTMT